MLFSDVCLSDVCLLRTSGLTREPKTKIGTEVAPVTRFFLFVTIVLPRLRNDLYCVEWDVKLCYTINIVTCT